MLCPKAMCPPKRLVFTSGFRSDYSPTTSLPRACSSLITSLTGHKSGPLRDNRHGRSPHVCPLTHRFLRIVCGRLLSAIASSRVLMWSRPIASAASAANAPRSFICFPLRAPCIDGESLFDATGLHASTSTHSSIKTSAHNDFGHVRETAVQPLHPTQS